MAFVKLDVGILDSTLWAMPAERDLFLTGLCMAKPFTLKEPLPQLDVATGQETGFQVPPGEYGFIPSAGEGIVRRAMLSKARGLGALAVLGEPEAGSRSADFEGRRLVRVNGGYIVLNYMKYRDMDYTNADRQRRFRARHSDDAENNGSNGVTSLRVTQAEADTEKKNTEEARRRAFPADADEKGWKKLAKELGLSTIPGEEMNAFKARVRRKAEGLGKVTK